MQFYRDSIVKLYNGKGFRFPTEHHFFKSHLSFTCLHEMNISQVDKLNNSDGTIECHREAKIMSGIFTLSCIQFIM